MPACPHVGDMGERTSNVEPANMATVQQDTQVGSDEKTQKDAARARPDADVMPAFLGRLGWVSQLEVMTKI